MNARSGPAYQQHHKHEAYFKNRFIPLSLAQNRKTDHGQGARQELSRYNAEKSVVYTNKELGSGLTPQPADLHGPLGTANNKVELDRLRSDPFGNRSKLR